MSIVNYVMMGLLGMASSSAALAAVEGLFFAHEDWALACDNTGTCRAAGYQAEVDYDAPVSLLLTRKAGGNSLVTGKLALMARNEVMPQRLVFKVNGQGYGTVALNEVAEGGLQPAQVAAILERARQNSRIELTGSGQSWVLSDQGLAAVLLKMDEFQKRVGTRSALIKKGPAGNGKVLQPEAMPVVWAQQPLTAATTSVPPQSEAGRRLLALLRQADGNQDCPMLFEEEGAELSHVSQDRLSVTPISARYSMVSSPCWMGAYNYGSGVWVLDQRLTKVHQFVSEGISDEADGRLYASHKGRGLGDCWSASEWVWNGREYALVKEASTGLCKGFAGGAWDLPTKVADVRLAK